MLVPLPEAMDITFDTVQWKHMVINYRMVRLARSEILFKERMYYLEPNIACCS